MGMRYYSLCSLLSLIICSLTSNSFAEDWSQTINTERPDFTDSAFTVPEGMTQIETGFTYQRLEGQNFITTPETLIRHTVSDNIELRLGTPNWEITRSNGTTHTNFSDIYAGLKFGLENNISDLFHLSIITATYIPAGHDGNESWSPEIKFCTNSELNETFALSTTSYFRSEDTDRSRRTIYQQTFSLGIGLTERLSAFNEYLFETYHNGPFLQIAHVGLSYLLTPDSQIDIHMARNLSGGYSEPFIAGGFSFRF